MKQNELYKINNFFSPKDNNFIKFIRTLKKKNLICHTTKIENINEILKSKYLKINNGDYKYSYPQSKNSFANYKKSISLFYFTGISDQKIFSCPENWYKFFLFKPASVCIIFKKNKISKNLISRENILNEWNNMKDKKTLFFNVEILSTENIHTSLIDNFCLTYEINGEFIFKKFLNTEEEINEMIKIIDIIKNLNNNQPTFLEKFVKEWIKNNE